MANPENENKNDLMSQEELKAQRIKELPRDTQLQFKINDKLNELRIHMDVKSANYLTGQVKQIQSMLDTRLSRKMAVIKALKAGKAPPSDLSINDSAFSQTMANLDLRSRKWLTITGYRSAYREMHQALNEFIDLRRQQIAEADKDIALLKKEGGQKIINQAMEDEIRKKLMLKKAA